MTPTVLVPLDGSEKDERVVPAATAFADLADGDLHLIRVLDLPTELLSPRARTMGSADAASKLRREMQRSVRVVADRLTSDTGRSVTTEVAEGFDVAEILLNSTTWRDAEFIVMATRAPGAVSRALLGSVADHLVRESPRPVVLVPPGVVARSGERLRLRRVLVPLDGSELALAAPDHVLALQHARELEFVLLEVVTTGIQPQVLAHPTTLQFAGLEDPARARADAQHRLERIAGRLRDGGVRDVRVRVEENADPGSTIPRVARDERADFIAMSTRGTSGVERLLLGSVAEAVVRASEVPVLLVRPRDR